MILIIDNFDSFTYNLADYFARSCEVQVVRNNQITLNEIREIHPKGIVISPGPGRPENSGISVDIVRYLHHDFPILGICLGHQLIAQYFGATISKARQPVHGKVFPIVHDEQELFLGIPQFFNAMRYHSLLVDTHSFPTQLEITAKTLDGEIMGIKHKIHNLAGVQFHPESILTEFGENITLNWLASLDRIAEELKYENSSGRTI